jgi:hypothetical protein
MCHLHSINWFSSPLKLMRPKLGLEARCSKDDNAFQERGAHAIDKSSTISFEFGKTVLRRAKAQYGMTGCQRIGLM